MLRVFTQLQNDGTNIVDLHFPERVVDVTNPLKKLWFQVRAYVLRKDLILNNFTFFLAE